MNGSCNNCCTGLEPITPQFTANRPGLGALSYRVGTHGTFLETMQVALSGSKFPALADLKTRDANDPSIAFLDAWATVADVLTFYQERIANEGYLRTATERRSVLELARLVGYKLRPGVSATVFPAFMMDMGYNSKNSEIPAGTRVQSLPGPGEMPQFFETAEKIAARTDWNEIKPRMSAPVEIDQDNVLLVETVYLKGISTNLKPGDPLLLTFRLKATDLNADYPEPEPVLRKIALVEPKPVENFTKVKLQAESLDTTRFLEAFRRLVTKYQVFADFCIEPESKDATKFINFLKSLIALPLPESLASGFIRRVLEYTADESFDSESEKDDKRNSLFLAIFALKKYGIESNWLQQLILELEKLVRAWYRHLPFEDQSQDIISQVLSWANWLKKINDSSSDQILDWYLAWSLDYELIIRSKDEFPEQSRKVLFLAIEDGSSYPILVFDPDGRKVIDGNLSDYSPTPGDLQKLQAEINNNNQVSEDQDETKKIEARILSIIASIIGAKFYDILSPVGISVFDGLSEAISPLSKSASIPPANRFQLTRGSEGFNPISDLRPRLAETFAPQLESNLSQVLISSDRLPTLPLRNPEAMRVKASTFGHNAPLKPIYNSKGAIEGYAEWPISNCSIGVRVYVNRPDNRIVINKLIVSIKLNGVEESQDVLLNANSSPYQFAYSGIGFTVSRVNSPPGINIRFRTQSSNIFPNSNQKTFLFTPQDEAIDVGIDEDTWSVPFDGIIRDGFSGRQISIFSSVDTNGILFVSDEFHALVSEIDRKTILLDSQYDQIQIGSWIAIFKSNQTKYYQVVNTQTVSKPDYGINGKVTQLTLDNPWLENQDKLLSDIRGVTIYAQGEPLELVEAPLNAKPICGQTIELDTIYEGLKAGRWLIVSGDRVDIPNTKVSELVMLSGVSNPKPDENKANRPYSTLTLSTKLAYIYKRETVKIYGNVVKATHGETRAEVLGSGDGSQAFQLFPLRQPPLTYLSAPTPAGAESTLQVRVNDVLWHEVDSLTDLKPIDRLFTTKIEDNGMTTVIFGNGKNGSRLPTGIENIKALYRSGIGKAGNVKAEQINLLTTRPLGLKGVLNPLPAAGGADRESRDQARKNAPLAVMSLDRLVSVQDYADFARTFAGVGKASAQKLPSGNRQILHVTIAGAEDIPIDESSDLYRNLKKAFSDFGDVNQALKLAVRKLVLLLIFAKVKVLPDYQWESVEPQIRSSLLNAFSFEQRELGQGVALSEIISIIQQIPGVAYVDVDLFNSLSEDDIKTTRQTKGKRQLIINKQPVTVEFNEEKNNLALRLDEIPKEPPLAYIPAELAKIDPKTRKISPAQLVIFSPQVADTLILTELKL
jgi:predicted phage baseplate assembly protein